LAAFYDDTHYRALKEAGPIRTEYPLMETPLLTLMKEISQRPSIKTFHFISKGEMA
jgi:oxaloacetate decarboxylase alpha subunit